MMDSIPTEGGILGSLLAVVFSFGMLFILIIVMAYCLYDLLTNRTMSLNEKLIWLFVIIVFVLVGAIAYLIARYNRKKIIDHNNIAPEINGNAVSGHISTTLNADLPDAMTTTESAAGATNDGGDVSGCIKKADESSINKIIKCQMCGFVQNLASDFKCTNCCAKLTYYIEVK